MKKMLSFITSILMVSSMTSSVVYAEGTHLPGGGYIPEGMEVAETPEAPDIVREPVSAELTEQLKAIYEQLKPFDDAQSTIFFNEGINDKILFTSVNQETVDKVKQFIADNGIDENLVLVDLEVPEDALVTTVVTTDKSITTTTSTTSDTNENRVDLRDFYEEIKEYSEEASAKYRKMTVDEVYKDILGNYVMLSAESENLRDHLLVMDENAKLHGMIKIQTETCVKVKSGTELPDIPSSVRYWVNEDVYILKSDDMNEVNKYVGSIKNNENVLAIDNHYGVYEDTVNDFRIEGFRYDGDELTEEFFAAYPHLGLKTNESDTKDNRHSIYCKIDKNAEPSDIFDEMVSLKKAVSGIEPVFIQTEVALITPVMYYCSYCNAPMLINGLDGDANIDGDMDIADAVMVMQSLANPDKYGVNKEKGITYQGIKNADTNKDGITNADALAIQKKLLGIKDDIEQPATIQTPPKNNSYLFDSYDDLAEALTKADSFKTADSDSYGELFNNTVSAFENKDITLYVPALNGKECELMNKEGFSNITLLTSELYNLPWIWYHCKADNSDIDIKLAYHSIIENDALNSAKTYYDILKLIAPEAPNPDNYTEFESYQKIYESKISLANDKNVDAMISEIKDSNKVYVMFNYDGMLVSIYADQNALTEEFWNSFSLKKV